ncbi:hypothetical protein SARC_01509 [Sphaeroforma arctica JP610]|uniref:Uncharacterized protein n=1 Tax=Sphaeroforma arctica JP610 TaxID=667725 RepID=A0A0L0GBH2_9EUKA|nr:hypothetical protein SARC_01509 [Sphaeroforma arctica JP610]KNC86350.1 hypothetical protein SARC_01509 [Sphaeroforma arctica JP610]|eukprot:XP_014160252.1 hypothetical protein SARC_01509 [Sphaeroforma arctica JP610]
MVCPVRVAAAALVTFVCAIVVVRKYNTDDNKPLTQAEEERKASQEIDSTFGRFISFILDAKKILETYRYAVLPLIVLFHVELISQGAICRYLFVKSDADEVNHRTTLDSTNVNTFAFCNSSSVLSPQLTVYILSPISV